MKKGAFWLTLGFGVFAGFYVGFFVGGLANTREMKQICNVRICEQHRSGKWLDGRCYEADGLREVKP
jgi:hypothetical protein